MNEWKNKSVVVIGLARSGVAVAKCLHRLGAIVCANDHKALCPEAEELVDLGIPVICGDHPEDLITENTDYVIKNPGVPYHVEPVQKALSLGIPVMTEVEVAGKLSRAPIIGITGSNGKTTTTSLVGEMLREGKCSPIVAGNIGTALTEVVQEAREDQWLVVELSSFQLKGTHTFHPHIAALLNIEEAHLDYHRTFDDYISSKKKLFLNQTTDDIAVLNRDSLHCRELSKMIRAKTVWFSRVAELEEGVFIKNQTIYACFDEKEQVILPTEEIMLCGAFNLENILAAIAIALSCGCPLSGIQEALRSFSGVEHRLEYVRSVCGVRYYNDSKATNVKAAKMALETFDDPIIWLAGGLDRGIDFEELDVTLKKRVKALISFGETKRKLKEMSERVGVSSFFADDIRDAVGIAHRIAKSGDIVLLSPACASWDMYTSFEERGSIFKQAVHSL